MKATKDAIKRVIAGETVLVPSGKLAEKFMGLVSLNETGSFIWDRLQNETNENELLKALLEEYDADERSAENDIKAFIGKLRENGLLEEDCKNIGE